MDSVSSRELKNHTGGILRRVRAGQRLQVTNRGKAVALLVPVSDLGLLRGETVRPYDEAWSDITAALAESEPEYETWQEATARSRRRS